MTALRWLLAAAVAISTTAPGGAADRLISVTDLDTVVRENPMPDGETAALIAAFPSGHSELGVLVMSRNRLHHHDHQDHVLYVARGKGIARLENSAGQIETRPIKPGDILSLPRGRKHAFAKTGEDNLVFLVLAGPGRDNPDDTIHHE
jgi:mannose-6-phosphate isomerase-like protein (cupin superfamily)